MARLWPPFSGTSPISVHMTDFQIFENSYDIPIPLVEYPGPHHSSGGRSLLGRVALRLDEITEANLLASFLGGIL